MQTPRISSVKLDDRENVTMQLLSMMRVIDLEAHNDRCCMAACVVAFLNCLRCGEFTVRSHKQEEFLTVGDWKQAGDRGEIYLKRCKTDVFGRGHFLKYRKMKSDLDPFVFGCPFMLKRTKFGAALRKMLCA